MTRAIAPERWNVYLELRKAGATRAFAAKEARISISAAKAFENGAPNSSGLAIKAMRDARDVPSAIAAERLSPEARRGLEDFAYFRRRYFGRISTPWQEEAAYKVVELLKTGQKEYLVASMPPGSGKSTLFSHDIPAWLTCRNRGIRGMIGSASMSLAERYTLALRTTLANPFEYKAEAEALGRGLAVDAESTLVADYGGFKPENTTLWTAKAFIVAQHDNRPTTNKEPTWSAYGPDSAQIGGRYDAIFWDDLVDEKSLATLESIEKMRRWWDRVAEKRLEPAGLLVMPGQRLSPEDLYRYCLDKQTGEDDEADHEGCCAAEPARKYHHLRYPAHAEDRCAEVHGVDSPPWPEGCLLDPRRLPWRELAAEMKAGVSNYRQVYQQEDADPEHLLVNKLWVTGGTDPVTKEFHPGCWDNDRGVGEFPAGLAGEKVSVISADPSPTRYWGITWWVYTPVSQNRYLMDLERRAMTAGDFLDWHHEGACWTGLLEEWWQRSVGMGLRVSAVVVEANAAQRFMLQYDHVRRWMAARDVRVIGHQTHANKADPKLGVTTLAPHWRFGRVRLPGKPGPGRLAAMKLVEEVTRWPMGRQDDLAMSQWMFEMNLERLYREPCEVINLWRPSFVRRGA